MSELIELFEHTPKRLPSEALSTDTARIIWQKYKEQITVDLPSFQANGN
jgi:hypothetical protein